MSSSEIGDPKMDTKVGYKDIKHPLELVQIGEIKNAEELSNLEAKKKFNFLLIKI